MDADLPPDVREIFAIARRLVEGGFVPEGESRGLCDGDDLRELYRALKGRYGDWTEGGDDAGQRENIARALERALDPDDCPTHGSAVGVRDGRFVCAFCGKAMGGDDAG